MRFRSIAVITLFSLAAAGTARAQGAQQEPSCTSQAAPVQDACQQAVDLFKYMVPQLGIGLTGGNFTLGQGGALGGLGHFSIGLRANAIQGNLPNLQTPSGVGIQQRGAYPVQDQYMGLPAVDVSIGIFKGLPLALSNVGGVDLLLSGQYIPTVTADEVGVTPQKNFELGYGARVGILQESLVVPGIGASFMIRNLPKTDVIGTVESTSPQATFTVDDFDLKTTSWRVTASKSLVLFTIAAGVGQDIYDASATISSSAGGVSSTPISVSIPKKLTRMNYFGDLAINLMVVKLVGEVGMVSGGDIPTWNTFTTEADASRLYGSVGLRFGF